MGLIFDLNDFSVELANMGLSNSILALEVVSGFDFRLSTDRACSSRRNPLPGRVLDSQCNTRQKLKSYLYNQILPYYEIAVFTRAELSVLCRINPLYKPFDRGSDGLKEFINRHQLTPELLKDAMRADPERYALLPGFLKDIKDIEKDYQVLMQEYGTVMPNAMYAPTYLLVGANRGIGQASLVGQLITLTRVADDRDKLEQLITHELSHFQQAMTMGGQKYVSLYSAPDNMLGLCLREGGAEFITSLVLGTITQTKALDYIENDEDNLKDRFQEDLKTQKKDFWLWASIDQESHPKLLGYAMGYKICRHYYDSSSDKSEALQDILMMEDAEAFLNSSGYFDR